MTLSLLGSAKRCWKWTGAFLFKRWNICRPLSRLGSATRSILCFAEWIFEHASRHRPEAIAGIAPAPSQITEGTMSTFLRGREPNKLGTLIQKAVLLHARTFGLARLLLSENERASLEERFSDRRLTRVPGFLCEIEDLRSRWPLPECIAASRARARYPASILWNSRCLAFDSG